MRKNDKGQILYSPSDLINFLGCRHATFLDVKNLTDPIDLGEQDKMNKLLQQKGFEHEGQYLQRLKKEGKKVVEIPTKVPLQEKVGMTRDALRSGADIVYQAAFLDAGWRGDADFLVKCDKPSALGDFSYEVLDTKLARRAKPHHVIQLSAYSEFLGKIQGEPPLNMHLLLGDGEQHTFRREDYFYAYTCAKRRFEDYVQNLPSDSAPDPCNHCKICRWHDNCNARWEEENHLSFVANINRSQRGKLNRAGIRTVADLAEVSPNKKIPDLNLDVFKRLHSQAALQHHKDITGEDKYESIPFLDGRGLDRLPVPDDGDLFFDIEGDPLYPKGLEYLFGIHFLEDGEFSFKCFWAHNHDEERKAFSDFMEFLAEHLGRYPHARIYHYNHYEQTALKRLSCRYAIWEEALDNLLRSNKFVDLYLAVRESIRTSKRGYSLKDMESFYMEARSNDVATGTDSIIVYEEWCQTNDDQLLRDIVEYNEADCRSLRGLRDWLMTLRSESRAPDENMEPDQSEGDNILSRQPWEVEYEEFQGKLEERRLSDDRGDNPPELYQRVSDLLEFHRRESKPEWWNAFDRRNRREDELMDDSECLAGLQRIRTSEEDSRLITYTFPDQEYKLTAGARPTRIDTENDPTAFPKAAGTIVSIDENACTIQIKAGREMPPSRLSLGPSTPIKSDIIRESIYHYAKHLLNCPDDKHVAAEILEKNLPRISEGNMLRNIIESKKHTHDSAHVAVASLDSSCLFIQGPPGAGKTHTSAHVIVALLKDKKKVGISANSHKAIHNLLHKIEELAIKEGVVFSGVKKATTNKPESHYESESRFIKNVTRVDDINFNADLFAGTVWAFSNPQFHGILDYLFVDEAGQVSIANIVAMSNATRNIVLAGDQMQLGQPIKGTHPGEAGLSVLDFLLDCDRSPVSSDQGIFLGQTHRMCPSICQFVSDAFYDGQLNAHQATQKRKLDLHPLSLPNEGIVMIPVDHEGCSQKSMEESGIIQKIYDSLLGKTFVRDGKKHRIDVDDILVVSPYNVQVNHLRSILPEKAKVGTVDKFQGREAPIVMISMVSSSGADAPRGLDFLYSRNRLNVAISRAQCLAIVVANPRLLEASCDTVENLKLVNTFCWLSEYAKKYSVNEYA